MARGRSGRGCGERLAESLVWLAILAALAGAGYWYFVINPSSAAYTLGTYLNAIKEGNAQKQYDLLAQSSRGYFADSKELERKFPPAHGLAGRVAFYNTDKNTESGNKSESNVTMTIRRPGQELYQAATDKYLDHYFLRKETTGWKVVLERSSLASIAVATPAR